MVPHSGLDHDVAASGGLVWFETRRRMRRKLERLERQRAVEHERARIAHDIHDDLGAHLTRISMLSESARGELDNPERAIAGLNQIYDTARDLTRAMDEIVWAVNPRHDTLEGLASYLEKFAQDLLARRRHPVPAGHAHGISRMAADGGCAPQSISRLQRDLAQRGQTFGGVGNVYPADGQDDLV